MGAINQVQALILVENNNYLPYFERYENLLKRIGLWNEEIQTKFKNKEIKKDNNFYFPINVKEYYPTNLSQIKIRPVVIVIKEMDNDLKQEKTWICFELLMCEDDIWDYEKDEFQPFVYDFIPKLVLEFYKEFNNAIIFFTNEWDDMQPIHAITENHPKSDRIFFDFDYALITNYFEQYYQNSPHPSKRYNNYQIMWNSETWKSSYSK